MTRPTWWFGRFGYNVGNITANNFQMLPQPDSGITVSRTGYVESLAFENGGQSVARSLASSRTFDMTWNVADSAISGGLDVYEDYAQGLYGSAPVYVSDPMNWRTNLFPPNWGSPMLSDGSTGRGWLPIFGSSAPAISATPTNSYNLPPNSATYTISSAPNSMPAGGNQSIYLPIPPGFQLAVGVSGAVTAGGASVQVIPVTTAGALGSIQNLTLLSPTGNVRINTVFSSANYTGIIVYLGRTTTSAASISLASMMAQMYPAGYSGSYPQNHIPGRGQAGMEFTTDAIPETYTLVDNAGGRSLKGLSLSMAEVSPWRTSIS